MEFELDDYLGLPTDLYEMEGGVTVAEKPSNRAETDPRAAEIVEEPVEAPQIPETTVEAPQIPEPTVEAPQIPEPAETASQPPTSARYTRLSKSNASKANLKDSILVVPTETTARFSKMSDIQGTENALAVSEKAVSNLLEDYFSDQSAPSVPTLKSSILDHLFVESQTSDVPLIQERQFAFLAFVHGLHAEAILKSEEVPAFQTDLVDKYVWLAHTLEAAKSKEDSETVLADLTKSDILKRFNEALNEQLKSFEELASLFMKPGVLYKMLQTSSEKETPKPVQVNEIVSAMPQAQETELVPAEAATEVPAPAPETTATLSSSVTPPQSAGAEAKTAEEYLADLQALTIKSFAK